MIAPVEIAGIANCMPEKKVTNFDLEKLVDTSDEWIKKRTGISNRRIVVNETAVSMGIHAAKESLDHSGINKEDVDLIITSTFTGETLVPSMSSEIQKAIGIDCACMDISAGCSGFVYAVTTAASLMDTLNLNTAIVIASEALSTYVDWEDRSTCVLFGDGAGAVVLKRSEKAYLSHPIIDGISDIEDVITLKREKRKTPFNKLGRIEPEYLKMKGAEVFTFAVGAVEDVLRKLLAKCGDKPFTKIIPHQANGKIIDYIVRKTKLKKDQFFMNIDEYANTSSATIPIAMCDAYKKGWLKKGDRLAIVGFGSGLSFGGLIIDWTI